MYPLLFFTALLFFFFEIVSNTFFPQYLNSHESIASLGLLTLDTLIFANSTPLLGPELGINEPSWSVSAEMIAYLCFGLASVFATGSRKRGILLLVILFAAVFSVWTKSYFDRPYYGFIRGLLSFNLGYFVWYFSEKKFSVSDKLEYAIPIILLGLLYQLHTYELNSPEKQMFGLFCIPLFFAFSILVLIKTRGVLSAFLESPPLQFLGKVSYSIYLNHFLLILLIPKVIFIIAKVPGHPLTQVLVLTGATLFVIFYSRHTYTYIERGGTQLLTRKLFPSPKAR